MQQLTMIVSSTGALIVQQTIPASSKTVIGLGQKFPM